MFKTPTNLRVLYTALGFTAVVMQGGTLPKKEGARRATQFAGLIEEFCRASVPEAYEAAEKENAGIDELEGPEPAGKFALVARMATAIVAIIKEKDGCLPHDLAAQGFTYEEIDRHWRMAKALAYVELKIMDS
jgi:hypothetical protein